MGSQKRPATFFDAETRIVPPSETLLALAEETRSDFAADCAQQTERVAMLARSAAGQTASTTTNSTTSLTTTTTSPTTIQPAHWSEESTTEFAEGSEAGTKRIDVAERLTASQPTAIADMTSSVEMTAMREPSVSRFPQGSNPPWQEKTIRAEGAAIDHLLQTLESLESTIPPNTLPATDAEPRHSFEAAPDTEHTELRPFTVPAGEYCAVNAPDLAAYQITKEIASGGMGIVYEAYHRATGKRVAVKYMREINAHQAKLVQRFLAEGVAASRVNHPGVTEVYDYGHDRDGVPFMVMEFLEGENLGDRLKRAPVTSREFLEISRQLVEVLAATHERGIIHRDLKPDNIFLVKSKSIRVKLLDFGVAKFLGKGNILLGATADGQVLGTPYYMSPEQCVGEEVSIQSDIYSLGCVFYQLLCGRVPFNGNIYDVILGHKSRQPIPLTSLRSVLPPAIVELVESMMAKKRADRPASMAEVGAALASIAAGNYQRSELRGGEPSKQARQPQSHPSIAPPDSRRGATKMRAAVGGDLTQPRAKWLRMQTVVGSTRRSPLHWTLHKTMIAATAVLATSAVVAALVL